MVKIDPAKASLLCRLLSSLYLDVPNESLLAELAQLKLAELWPFSPNRVPIEGDIVSCLNEANLPTLRSALRDDFMPLFIGPGMPLVPLWGSVYLEKENMLMGQTTYELEAFLARTGLACQLPEREPLDHMGYILAALGLFLGRLPEEREERLIGQYLGQFVLPWAPRCLALLHDQASTPFYRQLANLTSGFLKESGRCFGATSRLVPLFY